MIDLSNDRRYNICDAARTAGVTRLMLTSSQQAVGGLANSAALPREEIRRRIANGEPVVQLKDGTAPTNHYALTKVFSETIGEMYARGVQPRFAEAGAASQNQA